MHDLKWPINSARIVQVSLLSERQILQTAAAGQPGSLHTAAGWRHAVASAAVRVICPLLLHDSGSSDGATMAPLLRAAAIATTGSGLMTPMAEARAAARGEGGGQAANAALVLFRACISEGCADGELIRSLCDQAARGAATTETQHRWRGAGEHARRI